MNVYVLLRSPKQIGRTFGAVAQYRIQDDLADHLWYLELVRETIEALERYLANWAAFEDAVDSA